MIIRGLQWTTCVKWDIPSLGIGTLRSRILT